MVTSFLLIFLLQYIDINIASNDNYCTSPNWTPCSASGQTCIIPGYINQTTISYGGYNPNQDAQGKGQWVFSAITNTRGNEFKISCSSGSFGNVYPNAPSGTKLGCCFVANSKDSFVNFEGPSTNENNWKLVAKKGDKFVTNPVQKVRFGVNDALGGQYIYRWMQGEYECENQWFGKIQWWKNAPPAKCWTIPQNNITYESFIACGNNKVGQCNLDVTGATSDTESIVLVQYGNPPNFVHRYAFSTNKQDQIACNKGLFGNPNPNSGQEQFCGISNNTSITGAVGQWIVATSCAGSSCIIHTQIQQGTTSTNTKSTTKSWQHSVTQTVSSGFSFAGFSASYSLSTTTSTTVSHTVSNSYTQSVQKNCGVTCGNGSSADWTVYQWQFSMGQYQGTDVQPFDIYACYYVCSISNTPPKCPPGYCTPGTDCLNCTGWAPPTNSMYQYY